MTRKTPASDAAKLMLRAGFMPLVPYPGSHTPWKSRCKKCKKVVSPRYSAVKHSGSGCVYCAGRKNDPNDAIAFIKLKGFQPLETYPGGNKPWRVKCRKCKGESSPTLTSLKMGTSCGVCSGRVVDPNFAVRKMRERKLKPLVPYPGARKPWKSICLQCKREVSPKYSDVNQDEGGCKYCGGTYIDADTAVDIMKAVGLIPQTPYRNSGSKWKCVCSVCGKTVQPTYNSVQQGRGGCAFCARRLVSPSDAKLVMINANAKPLERYPGANKPWKCECLKCKRIIFPRYSEVKNRNYLSCAYCAGKKVDPNSALNLLVSRDITPLTKFPGSDKPWRAKCRKCKKVIITSYTRVRLGMGCRYCAINGLNYSKPAFLYLMFHEKFGAYKIGIGNNSTKSNRIEEHKRSGWKIYNSIQFSTGDEAFEVEQVVLSWLRFQRNLDVFLSPKQMPQRGYTETVDSSKIELVTIWNMILKSSKVKS